MALLSWFGFNTITEKDGFPITESRLFSLILAREKPQAIADGLSFERRKSKRRISDLFDKENGGKYNKLKRAEITRHGYVLLFLGEVL